MHWYGSGFVPILIYAGMAVPVENNFTLITENNFEILTENGIEILVE